MDGIIIINKPQDFTSRDIVNIVSKKLGTKKIGHTGTLDPLATGVLVLCVGRATKLVELLTATNKEYIAEVTLGIETDTLDITGKILKEENKYISKEEIEEVLKEYTCEYDQEAPIYSAIKVSGKKLYEYARNNEEVLLPKRKVQISNLELISDIKYENKKIIFSIKTTVSKGTYIRSLVRDIAKSLGTVGVMSKLQRTRQGDFYINDAYFLKQIEENDFQVKTLEDILKSYNPIIVDEELEFKIKNGTVLPNIYNKTIVTFYNKEEKALAIYKKDIQNNLRVYKMLK